METPNKKRRGQIFLHNMPSKYTEKEFAWSLHYRLYYLPQIIRTPVAGWASPVVHYVFSSIYISWWQVGRQVGMQMDVLTISMVNTIEVNLCTSMIVVQFLDGPLLQGRLPRLNRMFLFVKTMNNQGILKYEQLLGIFHTRERKKLKLQPKKKKNSLSCKINFNIFFLNDFFFKFFVIWEENNHNLKQPFFCFLFFPLPFQISEVVGGTGNCREEDFVSPNLVTFNLNRAMKNVFFKKKKPNQLCSHLRS